MSWYGHKNWRDETHIAKRFVSLHVDRWRGRWVYRVKSDTKVKGVIVISQQVTGQSGRTKYTPTLNET